MNDIFITDDELEECGTKELCPILRYFPNIFLDGVVNIMKNLWITGITAKI
jgi:hypothetical protein